jgi:hypothetical protein
VLDWPVGEAVLTAMRAEDLRAPAIVFTRSATAEGVRRAALALGATETIADWPDLFREIERVLGPA